MNAELVERVARAIHSPRYDNTGDYPLPSDFHTAGRVLAALGLDDLDAAVERMKDERVNSGWDGYPLSGKGCAALLKAALTPPEKP